MIFFPNMLLTHHSQSTALSFTLWFRFLKNPESFLDLFLSYHISIHQQILSTLPSQCILNQILNPAPSQHQHFLVQAPSCLSGLLLHPTMDSSFPFLSFFSFFLTSSLYSARGILSKRKIRLYYFHAQIYPSSSHVQNKIPRSCYALTLLTSPISFIITLILSIMLHPQDSLPFLIYTSKFLLQGLYTCFSLRY